MNNGNNDKKAKETKTCVITRMLKFNDYKDYIFNNEIILKSQERYKSERHKHILKKLIRRLYYVVMMIRDCKLLIELHHIHMVHVFISTCFISIKFNYYKDYMFNNEIILKSQERYKSERHKHILKKLIRRLY